MAHILRMHEQMDLAVYRDGHLSGDDVVFGILVVGSIEPEEIRVSLTDLVGVNWAEGSVRAGIAEIKCELPRLHLDRQRVGSGRCEIDAGPRLYAEHTQGQTFGTYQQESGYNQSRSSAGETLNFVARLMVGKLPDEKRQQELRGQERNTGF